MPQHFRSLKAGFIIFILIFFTFISINPLFAQGGAKVPANDSTITVKIIVAVPLANIGIETEMTLSKSREIRNNIQPSKSELELDSLIPQKLLSVEKLKKDTDLEEIEGMNLKQTENIKNDVSQLRSQLDGWRSTLTTKTEDINEMKSELADLKTQWIKTLELEREEKLPKQVTDRIQTNLTEVNGLNKELVERNNDLLTRQDEITGALIYLDEVLNTIAKTEETRRSQLLTIDSPPIWQMFDIEQDTLSITQRVKNIVEAHNSDYRGFADNYRSNIYYHLLIFVLLLFFTYFLKSEVSKWSDEKKDEAISYSTQVISKPFWSSFLVTLLLTGIVYSGAPKDVLDYYFALLVFPILTIVPGLIPNINKNYFYFVGGVFVLTQFQDYFSELNILDRSLLFLIDLLTIVLLVNLLRGRRKISEANPNINWGFAFMIMRLCVFLLSISIISNSVGNTVLSKLLSEGCLPMIYGGTIIYASALILKGLFALLIQHDSLSKLNMIQNYPDEVKHHIFRAIRLLAIIYWVYITLSGFEIFDPVYGWFEDFFTKQWIVGSVSLSAGSILAFFITLWISLTASRFIRFILQDEILTHFEMPRGVPGAIGMIVRLVLILIGFVLAFGAAKIDMSNITIIFGALGVGIGFGLQNIFNNLVSGLIVAFERPIQVGDTIQIATLNLMGEVKEIGIRASTVRTFDGAEVIVPNGNLISNEMINWTLSDHRRRQEIIVGVAYGTDTTKVLEILNAVVPEQENVLKNPAPFIIFVGFGDSSLDFRVLFWTHFSNGMGTKSAVGIAIDEAFKKAGITIPFPQRDLHLQSVSDSVDFQKTQKPVRATARIKSQTTAPVKKDKK